MKKPGCQAVAYLRPFAVYPPHKGDVFHVLCWWNPLGQEVHSPADGILTEYMELPGQLVPFLIFSKEDTELYLIMQQGHIA